MPEVNRNCDRCGQPMVIRENRATGGEFLGCSQWSPGSKTHCDFTAELPEYFRMVRSGNAMLPGLE